MIIQERVSLDGNGIMIDDKVANFDVTISSSMDADVGGADGPQVTSIELLFITVDNATLSNHDLIDMGLREEIQREERRVSEMLDAQAADLIAEAA